MYLNENDIEMYNKISSEIAIMIKDKKCTFINIEELKVGQFIYINFISDSQKYIYELYSKCGHIESIEIEDHFNPFTNKKENYYKIIIKNYNNICEELLHDGRSYLGGSLGYSYYIYTIE
jgi:hypothetical protein